MLIGYARVSTRDQKLELQADALRQAGCEQVYEEQASGSRDDRPVLAETLRALRSGDVLVVWKLDRLGRSLSHLIRTVDDIGRREVGFRSLTEGFDTTTPMGRMVFHVAGAFAQCERDIIVERTQRGLQGARARGHFGGRPAKLAPQDCREIRALYEARGHTIAWIAKKYRVSRRTVYRALETAPLT